MIDSNIQRNRYIKRIQINDLKNCFSFWDFEYNLDKRKRIEREIVNEKRMMYAYILNGEYIAGMSLQQLKNNTICLSYLAVKEDCRNCGVGTEMIKYACQIGKENGNLYVILNVDNDNFGAERLYEKLGFIKSEINNSDRIKMIKVLHTEDN